MQIRAQWCAGPVLAAAPHTPAFRLLHPDAALKLFSLFALLHQPLTPSQLATRTQITQSPKIKKEKKEKEFEREKKEKTKLLPVSDVRRDSAVWPGGATQVHYS